MPVAVPSLICDIHPSLSTEHSGSHTYYDISHLKNRRTLTSHFLTKHHVFRKTEPSSARCHHPCSLEPTPLFSRFHQTVLAQSPRTCLVSKPMVSSQSSHFAALSIRQTSIGPSEKQTLLPQLPGHPAPLVSRLLF